MKTKSSSPRKKKILLVDDHKILREGLRFIIEQEKNLTVCAEAENYGEALTAVAEFNPDLVLLDITLDGRNGLDLIKELKVSYPALPVLVLSMHDEQLYAQRVIQAGGHGYLMKSEASESVIEAINQVLAGKIVLSDAMRDRIVSQMADGGKPMSAIVDVLSDRELQVFEMTGKGMRPRSIAGELKMSIKTVETHLAHIKQKLGIKNAGELLQHAIQWANRSA